MSMDTILKKENLERVEGVHTPLIWQISVDFYSEEPELLNSPEYVIHALVEAAKQADITVVSSHYNKLPGQGLSAVVFLVESHISLHTWPEYGYGSLDIEVCDGEPEKALDHLVKAFKIKKMKVRRIERGLFD